MSSRPLVITPRAASALKQEKTAQDRDRQSGNGVFGTEVNHNVTSPGFGGVKNQQSSVFNYDQRDINMSSRSERGGRGSGNVPVTSIRNSGKIGGKKKKASTSSSSYYQNGNITDESDMSDAPLREERVLYPIPSSSGSRGQRTSSSRTPTRSPRTSVHTYNRGSSGKKGLRRV